jgi:hypothetical protein
MRGWQNKQANMSIAGLSVAIWWCAENGLLAIRL